MEIPASVNQDAILWLFGICITVQLAVIGALVSAMWSHIQACKTTSENLARLNANVDRIMMDIGSHETGLRGTVHEHSQFLTRHELDIEMLKAKR